MNSKIFRREQRSRFEDGEKPVSYRLRSLVGRGGMAEVYRGDAIFEDGGRETVAIKRMRPDIKEPIFHQMFDDEARLGRILEHPNLVRVYDIARLNESVIIVMELIEGACLKSIYDRLALKELSLSIGAALYIIRELATGLEYAHQFRDEEGNWLRIVHRDVSPHNLLISQYGDIKVMDFGLSEATIHETVREKHIVGGKFGYLAPEIVKQADTDHRVDIFGMGIILFELLAGQRLFLVPNDDRATVLNVMRCEVPRLSELGVEVPPSVQRLLDDLLAAAPEDRLPTARAVIRRIEAILVELEVVSPHREVAEVVAVHLAQDARVSRVGEAAGLAELAAQALDEGAFVEVDELLEEGLRVSHPLSIR